MAAIVDKILRKVKILLHCFYHNLSFPTLALLHPPSPSFHSAPGHNSATKFFIMLPILTFRKLHFASLQNLMWKIWHSGSHLASPGPRHSSSPPRPYPNPTPPALSKVMQCRRRPQAQQTLMNTPPHTFFIITFFSLNAYSVYHSDLSSYKWRCIEPLVFTDVH